MLENISKLNLVRIGSYITYSSLKKIGDDLLESFSGIIGEVDLSHHDSPMIDSIDAQLLTLILGEEYIGNTLGITDADLKIDDGDEFYNSIIGGKNPKNDVAVVSTKGLTDHASFKPAPDGALCPMSRGEFNKFGYRGYVRAIVDGRGLTFCDECSGFLRSIYGYRSASKGLVKDGLVSAAN
jgi:hypothetical protein